VRSLQESGRGLFLGRAVVLIYERAAPTGLATTNALNEISGIQSRAW
jgi:hypothetical protein